MPIKEKRSGEGFGPGGFKKEMNAAEGRIWVIILRVCGQMSVLAQVVDLGNRRSGQIEQPGHIQKLRISRISISIRKHYRKKLFMLLQRS